MNVKREFESGWTLLSWSLLVFLLLILSASGCQSKGKERNPPPGAVEFSSDENAKLSLALYEDRVEFRNNGSVEESYLLVDFEGANFTPGGAILFFTGGKKRIIAFNDYGGAKAGKIIEKVVNGG